MLFFEGTYVEGNFHTVKLSLESEWLRFYPHFFAQLFERVRSPTACNWFLKIPVRKSIKS
ncbi:hypothetical protein [Microcoleus sp. F4-D5]|uniref:hypothetical protein n=1 Tax=Microcoleus sp. F4-D5 TaxID=2818760 RepID=UPI002FD51558